MVSCVLYLIAAYICAQAAHTRASQAVLCRTQAAPTPTQPLLLASLQMSNRKLPALSSLAVGVAHLALCASHTR